MKQKLRNFSTNADGIAHLGLILLILLVLAVISISAYRVMSNNSVSAGELQIEEEDEEKYAASNDDEPDENVDTADDQGAKNEEQ